MSSIENIKSLCVILEFYMIGLVVGEKEGERGGGEKGRWVS